MEANLPPKKLRVGILSTAHMHCLSYVHSLKDHPKAEIVGIWDNEIERGEKFAQQTGLPFVGYLNDLLEACDAVAITSENNRHLELVEAAAKAKKNILCEKPLVALADHAERMEKVVEENGVKLMTAFPCRFSPAFQTLKRRVASGEIGNIKAISATNRGKSPGGWFVEKELSGGGAMIDHVVHVTDLLRDLLQEEPARVQAQTGNNVYGQSWEDTAMVTIEFRSGIFATLDSSWSRPGAFKTWGDVTMKVIGDAGMIELDMFGAGLDFYSGNNPNHAALGYGSNLDGEMVDAFINACVDGTPVPVTMHDGLQAARVALAGYKSVELGQPVTL